MKVEPKTPSTPTLLFAALAPGDTFRKEQGGLVFMKMLKGSMDVNMVGLNDGIADFLLDTHEVIPVYGTFREE